MFKVRKVKLILVASLVMAFVLMIFSPIMVAGQAESISENEEKLMEMSEEEKQILQSLFLFVQEIEEMERAEEEIAREIEIINREIKSLEDTIAREEMDYEKKRDVLRQVLKSYQKGGPGSYLEIIMTSDSLTMFLRRINTLRDLTRNTGELLAVMEESRENLSEEKAKLDEKLVLMKEKQEQSRVSLAKKLQLIKDREAYLAALEEKREYYQEHLAAIQQVWDEVKPLFSEITKEFSHMIEEGNLPPHALKTTFTFSGIKGYIQEETFNEIITGNPSLPKLVFSFHPGRIEMELPEKNLILSGTFVIQEGHTLKFQVNEGRFFGVPLEKGSLEDLFREASLILNLESLMGGNILRSVEIREEHLALTIIPNH